MTFCLYIDMKEVEYYHYHSPIGWLSIGCLQNKIVSCSFGKMDDSVKMHETSLHKEAIHQLQEYFEEKRQDFDLEYEFLIGTPFQQKVWKALLLIPYGQTVSYQDIAQSIGSPKACRAVGGANHKNPIAIFVPCHRVIGTNGTMVGYGGGIDKKVYLLNLEKRGI